MKKEIKFGLVCFTILGIILLVTKCPKEKYDFEPTSYRLTDFDYDNNEKDYAANQNALEQDSVDNQSTLKKGDSIITDASTIELIPTAKAAINNKVKTERVTVKDNKLKTKSATVKDNKPETKSVTVKDNKPETESVTVKDNKPETKSVTFKTNKTIYKIQLFVSYQLLPENSPLFKGLTPIEYYKVKNIYKYTYGSSSDYEKILNLKESIIKQKFNDAFIVAFKNGKKVPLDEK